MTPLPSPPQVNHTKYMIKSQTIPSGCEYQFGIFPSGEGCFASYTKCANGIPSEVYTFSIPPHHHLSWFCRCTVNLDLRMTTVSTLATGQIFWWNMLVVTLPQLWATSSVQQTKSFLHWQEDSSPSPGSQYPRTPSCTSSVSTESQGWILVVKDLSSQR